MNKIKLLLIGILIIFSLTFISFADAKIASFGTYALNLGNRNGTIYPISLDLYKSFFSEYSNLNEGNYSISLLDSKKKILYSVKFGFEGVIIPQLSEECFDSITRKNICNLSTEFYELEEIIIYLPYLKEAKWAEVYKNKNLLFSYELAENVNIPGEQASFLSFIFDYKYIIGAFILLFIVLMILIWKEKKKHE